MWKLVMFAWLFNLLERLYPLDLHYDHFWYPRFYTRKVYEKVYISTMGPSCKSRDPREPVLKQSCTLRWALHEPSVHRCETSSSRDKALVKLPWTLHEPFMNPEDSSINPTLSARARGLPKGSRRVHGEPFSDPESFAILFLKSVYTSKIEPLMTDCYGRVPH